MKSGSLTIQTEQKEISFKIKKSKAKLKFDKEKNVVTVKIKAELQTTEIYTGDKSLIHLKEISDKEIKMLSDLIKKQIDSAARAGKENGIDIFDNVSGEKATDIKTEITVRTIIK